MEDFKVLTIFAGINGAGKSTLYYSFGEENFGVRLNSDEIVASMGKDWRSTRAQVEAGKKLINIQEQCFLSGVSFNRETTLAGNNILNTIVKAKSLGYKVNLLYIGLDSLSIAKKRVDHRVRLGGHGVDEKILDIRYSKINKNLAKVIPLCDNVQLFDNSKNSIKLVAYKEGKNFVKTDATCSWLDETLKIITSPDKTFE